MRSTITIQGMEFYAYHGCFEEERKIGTRFLVDVSMQADTTEAEQTDDLSKTVNYQSVYATIQREMAVSSRLLEHVAHRIIQAISAEFPVQQIKIEVKKLNPPLGGKIDYVSVILSQE
ncbi:MAG: dihydroneopterin aldolase [Bacteroidales bacterium]|nr:dihydroneopterin aldolase [Bacteroidales bacterium]